MPLMVEILGAGDAFGSGGRFHSCSVLRAPAGVAVVDCGASAPVALQRRGLDPGEIGVILVTHLHGDHFGGVPFVLLDGAFNRRRDRALTIAGPPGVEEAILRLYEGLFPGTAAQVRSRVSVTYVELQPLQAAVVDFVEVTPYPVSHGRHVASNALRITAGDRIVAFSSDTEWHPHLEAVSRDADLFVCECSGYRDRLSGHLTLDDLRAHAAELTARRIVLNHLGREMLLHAREAPWECAEDGMVIEL